MLVHGFRDAQARYLSQNFPPTINVGHRDELAVQEEQQEELSGQEEQK